MNVDAVEIDTLFDLCRDQRRRAVLALLADRRASITVPELANALVGSDGQSRGVVPEGDVDRLRISLHHVHLPKLAAGGLVEYDSDHKVAEPTATFDRLLPVIPTLLSADSGIEPVVE